VLTGRRGARDQATALAATATADVGDSTLGHLSRLLAAGPALTDGWGEPARWLAAAQADFAAKDFTALAAWCQELLSVPSASRLGALGITPREAEILGLIAAGLANKDIAARLYLSPRTVEKHVESLLTSRACCGRPARRRAPCSSPSPAPGRRHRTSRTSRRAPLRSRRLRGFPDARPPRRRHDTGNGTSEETLP
jgi:hypothetical protein